MFWNGKSTNGSSQQTSGGDQAVITSTNKNSLSNQHLNKIDQQFKSKQSSFDREFLHHAAHKSSSSPLSHANRSNSLHYVSSNSNGVSGNTGAGAGAGVGATFASYTSSRAVSSKPPHGYHYHNHHNHGGESSSSSVHAANSVNSINSVSSGTHKASLPFYNRLKKSHHLFGSRLEKLCGPYSPENNRLPASIMVSCYYYIFYTFLNHY